MDLRCTREIIFSDLQYVILSSTIDMPSIHSKPVDVRDREELVSFFEEVMSWPGFEHAGETSDYWDWKYRRKPGLPPIDYAAWNEGSVASHASATPVPLMIMGRPVTAGQLEDLYTHPRHRGNGLAESLLNRVEERAAAEGLEFLYAFPSEIGRMIISNRGFRELPVRFSQFQLITDPAAFFDQVRLGSLKRPAYKAMLSLKSTYRRSHAPGMVREVSEFPDDIEDMTRRFEANFDITLRHDRSYLEWRYADPAGGFFRTLLATIDGRTAGMAVVRTYNNDGTRYMDIIDLMADLERPKVAQALVAKAVAMAESEHVTGVQAWIPSDHPFVPTLQRTGLIPRTPLGHERKLTMFGRPIGRDAELSNIFQRRCLKAHIMLGDSDWV